MSENLYICIFVNYISDWFQMNLVYSYSNILCKANIKQSLHLFRPWMKLQAVVSGRHVFIFNTHLAFDFLSTGFKFFFFFSLSLSEVLWHLKKEKKISNIMRSKLKIAIIRWFKKFDMEWHPPYSIVRYRIVLCYYFLTLRLS